MQQGPMQQGMEGGGAVAGPPAFLFDGPAGAALSIVLAHGAGAPMDTPFMSFFAGGLAARGFRVARFEFPYMAARRVGGGRRPPDRTPVLLAAWRAAIAALGPDRLVIGGKSLGGRMASMLADEANVRGLVCLGYPFHPPGRPQQPRIRHLYGLRTPALILQGTRDPFGTREEVAAYALSPAIRVHFLEDGDHGFAPRAASGRKPAQNLEEALSACHDFLAALGDAQR
jgi:uncharacterized protein